MNPRVVRTDGDVPAMAAQIRAAFADMSLAAVMLFAADGRILLPLSQALAGLGGRIMGCSTAGGFAFGGYDARGVVAIGLPARHFRVNAIALGGVHDAAALEWMPALRAASEATLSRAGWTRFGILLIDGLGQREELVSAMIDATLPGLLVLGGSAGDGLRFGRTHLALDGQGVAGAVFCLMATDFRIEEVIFDHISPTPTRLVVTDARPEQRLILEINAEPAAEEYARLIGADPADLGPALFAENPLLVRIGGQQFVRAISGVADDGLRLMSSVATGEVMTLGRADDLTGGLEARLSKLAGAALILGFDCILRRIALERAGQQGIVARLYRDYNVAGFNTYGEQHRGIHVNHTFVGLAFLPPEARA